MPALNAVFPGPLPGFGLSIAYLSAFVIFYYVAYAIYNLYFHPLSKFPGPKLSAVSRLPLIRSHFQGKQHEYQCKIHTEYGSIVRVSPDELTINTSGGWRDIYMTKPGLPKDPFSRTPPPNGAETLFSAEGETHVRLRRNFSNAFSDRSLRAMALVIESHATRLTSRLRNDIGTQSIGGLDIAKYYGYTTLDVMGELALGESFNGLDVDSEHSWVKAFFMGVKFGSMRTSLSRYWPLDMIIGEVIMHVTAKQRQKNLKVGQDMISRRLALGDLGPDKSDLISPVIGKVDSEKANGITRAELDVNVISMLLAGSPLTTVAVAAATYYLLRFPSTMAELKQEIRSTFENEQEIKVSSTQALTYLEAVIMESLRIHHPTPSDPKPRKVGSSGQNVDGHWIPGNTVIGVPLHATYSSPNNFLEPEIFHPERWLPRSDPRYDARFDKDDKEAFQPFSTGTRNCMGRKIFLAEAKVMLARTFFAFDMELGGESDWLNWPDQQAWLSYEPKPLMVKMKERVF